MKLRVLLLDDDEKRRRAVEAVLTATGYAVIAGTAPGCDLMRKIERLRPDVTVIDLDAPDRGTLDDLCCVARDAPHPVVMFTHDDDAEKMRAAIRAGVSAYVVGGVSGERVGPIVEVAVMRFEQHQALRAELRRAQASLVERKVVERAKGILMRQRRCSEDEAYQALRRSAMACNRRLVEVAQGVVDAARLLG